MKFILPKEMIPELLSGKIDEGVFEDHIEFEHFGILYYISLRASDEDVSYFIEEDILCEIEYTFYDDSTFIEIYVSEYTFRQVLLGRVSLEEVLNKQRGYILAGPFRSDEEYKLMIK